MKTALRLMPVSIGGLAVFGEVVLALAFVVGVARGLFFLAQEMGLALDPRLLSAAGWLIAATILIQWNEGSRRAYGLTLSNWRLDLKWTLLAGSFALPFALIWGAWATHQSFSAPSPSFEFWLSVAFVQIFFVGAPEEIFFRGPVQGLMNRVFPNRYLIFGVPCGAGLIVAAVLFGLAHALTEGSWERAIVVVPALLFGWLRERTGSVLAPALVHGVSNAALLMASASF